MSLKKWVVFNSKRFGSRANLFAEAYWTGEFTAADNPSQTGKVDQAKHFNSKEEAYATAGQHNQLNRWRVGLREVGVLQ